MSKIRGVRWRVLAFRAYGQGSDRKLSRKRVGSCTWPGGRALGPVSNATSRCGRVTALRRKNPCSRNDRQARNLGQQWYKSPRDSFAGHHARQRVEFTASNHVACCLLGRVVRSPTKPLIAVCKQNSCTRPSGRRAARLGQPWLASGGAYPSSTGREKAAFYFRDYPVHSLAENDLSWSIVDK